MYIRKSDCCASPGANNERVRASLSAAEMHFLKRVSFFEMNRETIARRCSNHLRGIQESEFDFQNRGNINEFSTWIFLYRFDV